MLSFPNQSRSYDQTADRIRFWGHDGVSEIPIFLKTDALFRRFPKTTNKEPNILAAFDQGRDQFEAMAVKAHARGRRTFYVIES